METRTIRSGAPYVLAGLFVLAYALAFGMSSLIGYCAAVCLGCCGFVLGRRMFPDHVVEVERAPNSGDAQVDALIAEARAQLDAIAQANEAIAEAVLSAQIDDIETTCRTMLLRLEEQPGMLSSMRTFLRYYLPATLKLLSARAKIEGEVSENPQIANRIREAMAQVQAAFHKQLDALNDYRFINLESEMDVLAEMLRSDGLTDEETQPVQAAQQEEEDPFAGLFTQSK